MKKIKIGFIGLSKRGIGMMKTILTMIDNVEICGVCDLYEDRIEDAVKLIEECGGKKPETSVCADDIINMKETDAIMIMTAWESHIDLAIKGMYAGKYVAMEVGGAYSIEDCWRLVRAYRDTKMPCMMLENCCYGKVELTVLKMVREGLFGEICHCSGGYNHDLRDEICGGNQIRHYRLRNYLNRNCENYPTHELGPIAKILNIGRGNRMISLTSTSSKSKGLMAYVDKNPDKYGELSGKTFNQGDIVTTVIKCADGATITLTLDTTLSRPYSRGFTVRGVQGAYFEDNNMFYFDNEHRPEFEFDGKKLWGNGDKYIEENLHPLWVKYGEKAKEAGHDGMDYMVLRAFFESVEKQTQTPIDIFDTVSWMAITPLSEKSIACGSCPVEIPDFTSGEWYIEKEIPDLEFSLD